MAGAANVGVGSVGESTEVLKVEAAAVIVETSVTGVAAGKEKVSQVYQQMKQENQLKPYG